MIERKLVIGLITSTEFLNTIRHKVNADLIESPVAKLLVRWCLDYYDQYHVAPGKNIEQIYYSKLKTSRIQKDLAEEIEEDILPGLSEEYVKEGVDLEYLINQSTIYLTERALTELQKGIEFCVEKGDLNQAEELIAQHKVITESEDEVQLNGQGINEIVKEAFTNSAEPIVEYPGALGEMWNGQMIRGNFVAFLSPEKRGKSWMLIDIAIRASQQGRKVAFFQAGDMTRNQQIRRIGIYLAQKSDKEKYVGQQFLPVKDCLKNQLNICDKNIRECDFGVFEDRGWNEKTLRDEITKQDLIDAWNNEQKYKNCYNCQEWKTNPLGAVWLQQVNIKNTLSVKEAQSRINSFFVQKNRQLRISTHPNDTLSVKKIQSILNNWKVRDGFVPDLIVIDYADLLVPDDSRIEFRHQQNKIWKSLRGLNQKLDCLLITATQSDANSYEQNSLRLKNFSEDKRKYAHVTAMYALNQDPLGREKKLGILRVGELILREDEFDMTKQVTVLQSLKTGRPVCGSYF